MGSLCTQLPSAAKKSLLLRADGVWEASVTDASSTKTVSAGSGLLLGGEFSCPVSLQPPDSGQHIYSNSLGPTPSLHNTRPFLSVTLCQGAGAAPGDVVAHKRRQQLLSCFLYRQMCIF